MQAANTGALSPDEIAANQLQVDSAVESITRISNTTTFAGLHLLNGSLDYVTSGVDTSAIKALHISQANFGTNANIPVQINVITSAKTADLEFRASSIASSVTLEITGNDGVQTLTFTSGTTASAIAFAVNRISDSTGVTADLINAGNAASRHHVPEHRLRLARASSPCTAQTGTFATDRHHRRRQDRARSAATRSRPSTARSPSATG